MRHVWLPSLGVWAPAQEPSVADFASSTSTSCQSLESRTGSAMATSCSNGEWSSTEIHKHNPRRCHDHRHHHSHHNNQHGGGSHGHNRCCRKDSEECEQDRLGVHDPHHKASDQHEYHHDGCDGSHHPSLPHHKAYDECNDYHHGEPHHTCPICLSPISQSSLTVLRWCMHQFCLTCIEKWSCMQRFCPLCKQIFHGWYYNIQSPSVFDKKDVAAKSSSQTSSQLRTRGTRESRYLVPRQPTSLSVRSSKPLPWRRNFRFSRRTTLAHFEKVLESKGDEEALQWRASVYKKNLRAVPPHVNSRVKIKQAPAHDPERKARIGKRLEPWIFRELRAIMEDSNPSLLVHLVLSLWLHALSEREESRNSEHHDQRDRVLPTGLWDSEAIKQLEPFLQERASVFWHELRCFAESPFSLRTYDSVTKYEKCRG